MLACASNQDGEVIK
jgi:hypothetical protein